MSTAIITTDSVFGPWIIPHRGQNIITSQYAEKNDIVVDANIPEPLFSKQLWTTRWSRKSRNLSAIILCSIHQLPQDEDIVEDFMEDMQNVEIHCALETLSGKGRDFLSAIISEAASFQSVEIIDYKEANSYEALFKIMQDGTSD
jgi:sporadic carbohydrate cluster protein (TIGR04323 family)